MTLARVEGRFAVCRLPPDAPVPAWATSGSFVSITRTGDELSIVCEEEAVPDGVFLVRDFAALRVVGKIDFGTIGVLASMTRALADAGVSVIAISTFDTDYLLMPTADLERSLQALSQIATIA